MILHIYANYNILGGFFSDAVYEKITPDEMSKDYVQLVAGIKREYLEKLKECDLYCLGTFDNVSGEIVSKKDFILHCGDAIKTLLKEEKEEVSA